VVSFFFHSFKDKSFNDLLYFDEQEALNSLHGFIFIHSFKDFNDLLYFDEQEALNSLHGFILFHSFKDKNLNDLLCFSEHD
jgi:hypothetical protein